MKKLHFWLLTAVIMFLQSCSVETEITYHKDKTQSISVNFDMKEMIKMADALGKDSTQKEQKTKDFLSKEWISAYDLALQEGKEIPADSAEIMKKFYVKGNYYEDELSGFGFRIDNINEKDNEFIEKFLSDKTINVAEGHNKNQLKDSYKVDAEWNGKILNIYTKDWQKKEKKSKKKEENELEDIFNLEKMFGKISLKQIIRFDEPIEKIKGKHDWIKQVDDKTLEIHINFDEMDKKLKHNDENIIITIK